MNLKEHYDRLYQEAITQISLGHYQVDDLINSGLDKRFGLSLLIRPSIEVKDNIQLFLKELKEKEPNQYYYPNSDIHITLLSIISCYEGFDSNRLPLPEYISLIQKVLADLPPINIHFKGVTASPSCVMIQGFMEDNCLNTIRENLKKVFKNKKLEQSIDQRYPLRTAHATVFRFSEKLQQKKSFLQIIEKYRNYDFGTFEVNAIELVVNDWYQRFGQVEIVHRFTTRT